MVLLTDLTTIIDFKATISRGCKDIFRSVPAVWQAWLHLVATKAGR
jgi:hypothetical protein